MKFLDLLKNRVYSKKFRELLYQSFPEETDFIEIIYKLADKGQADLITVTDNDEFVGLCAVIKINTDANYLLYFATCPEKRNKGLGVHILQYIKSKYAENQKLLLAIKKPADNADASDINFRRQNFYLRNGFQKSDFEMPFSDITYLVLYIGEGIDNDFITDFAAKILKLLTGNN